MPHPLGGSVSVDEIPELVRELYRIVSRLEQAFPGREFTPDGHLVGSLGEVLAAHRYGLELLPASTPEHDARALDGRLVQIKATQTRQVALRAEPQHLIVLALRPDGTTTEIYNGPGSEPWTIAGPMQRNGQRVVSFSKLTGLMESLPVSQSLLTGPDDALQKSG